MEQGKRGCDSLQRMLESGRSRKVLKGGGDGFPR